MTDEQKLLLIAGLVASTMYQCAICATALVIGSHAALAAILICMALCYLSALVQLTFGPAPFWAGGMLVLTLATGAYAGFSVLAAIA